MVELNTSVHSAHETLAAELKSAARRRHAGGAAAERAHRRRRLARRSTSGPIAASIRPSASSTCSTVYGYLAKQFTIFGQHVHIGCPDGDAAVYLTHILARYVPHFIALSASSPFQQGEDTSYQSSRLNTVSAFPLSGHDAVRAFVERVRRVFRQDARLRHRREHEGFLLGHPPQAGVRHRRDPRLRHAAHGRARGAASLLRAGARAPHPRRPPAARRRGMSTRSTTTTASRRAATGLPASWSTPTRGAPRASGRTCSIRCRMVAPHAAALGNRRGAGASSRRASKRAIPTPTGCGASTASASR